MNESEKPKDQHQKIQGVKTGPTPHDAKTGMAQTGKQNLAGGGGGRKGHCDMDGMGNIVYGGRKKSSTNSGPPYSRKGKGGGKRHRKVA